ncbi:MAG: tRNA (cytidine(34)-2'-O)-methyltransferase [Clostridium sp.]|nr:tRNA (cytidine(34)-2'-O)-methyltransferase [Clostridium sp.]
MLNIVLFRPEIAYNTGNIGRTCYLTGSKLHIIGPAGFSLDDKHIKKAGLDYWNKLDVKIYGSYRELREKYKDNRFFFSTTKGDKLYSDIEFKDTDFIVFGRESSGLPEYIHVENKDNRFKIPMLNGTDRSLNLCNTVSIVVYEALRQINFINLK